MFGNVLRNVRTSSSRGTLEGRKLRVVVVEVIRARMFEFEF